MPSQTTRNLLYLLKQCTSVTSFKQTHAQMIVNSIHKPNFLLPKLIDLEAFHYASLLFSNIPQPDEYAFNVMIRGLATTWKRFDLALQLYRDMKFTGLTPNKFTYPFLFIACGNIQALENALPAHSSILKNGLSSDDHVAHSLITMYSKCGELGPARMVFDEIADKDLVSWNSMISGYLKMGFAEGAVKLFERMIDEGFKPDEMTMVSVLAASADLGDLSLGRSVLGLIAENNLEINSYTGSALIDVFGKCGDLFSARNVFNKLLKKDAVTWNAMISSYARNGASGDAIILFNGMRKSKVKPDKITITEMLSVSSSIGALRFGECLDAYALKQGLRDDCYVAASLIDMYFKCGCSDDACRLFSVAPHKNVVSWNTMISSLGFHGCALEALELFKLMLEVHGTPVPDDITFVGVLSACVHAGLVDEGYQVFNLLNAYNLVPKIEHYSCMVDLLSRAGLVERAWDFILHMPAKPDEVILGALLGACEKARNLDIGEKVMGLLLEIGPTNSGNYVISSKMYAKQKRWDHVAQLRGLMRKKGVSKTPSCSWIEIEHQIKTFHAGDRDCLVLEELCVVFNLLNTNLMVLEEDIPVCGGCLG